MISKDMEVTPSVLVEGLNSLEKSLVGYETRLGEWDGKWETLGKQVNDALAEFKAGARRDLGEGLATKLFEDHDLDTALTWDALHKAPTAVRRKTGSRISRHEFDKADTSDLMGRFQDAADELYMVAAAMKLVDADGRLKEGARGLKMYRKYAALKVLLGEKAQKDGFALATAGAGLEWDFTGFSNRLFEKQRVPLGVEALIPSFPLPRSPFVFPVELDDLTAYLVAEITTAPPVLGTTTGYIPDGKGATLMTSSKTFTSVKLATMAFTSKEAEEDLIIPILPRLEYKVIQSINIAKERGIVRGGKTVSLDADVTAATDNRKAFDGLVDYAVRVSTLATLDANGQRINTDDNWRDYFRATRKKMADAYKGNNANIAAIVSGNTAIDIGSCQSFRTAYAMGGMSTNRNGDSTGFSPDGLGDFVVSEYIRSDLAATGKYVAPGDALTCAVQFYPQAWLLGVERNLRLEVLRERFAEFDVDAVKVTWRGDLKAMLAGNHTVATINIDAT